MERILQINDAARPLADTVVSSQVWKHAVDPQAAFPTGWYRHFSKRNPGIYSVNTCRMALTGNSRPAIGAAIPASPPE